jgi:hypothetical protein
MKLAKFRNPKIIIALAIVFLHNIISPTIAFALSGGPSQPEIQSFEPVGTSDMVDVFSGDFNYNIPLLDVEGYPVNIAYHSGISMDQEASWVGLGWNINPGAINRDIRGIPDDFSGEETINKELNTKPNKTIGVTVSGTTEIFGSDVINIGLTRSITGTYNNYRGIGIEQSVNFSISAGEEAQIKGLSGNLGLTASADNGLTIQPSVNFKQSLNDNYKAEVGVGIGVSGSFNSRGGLKTISISKTVSLSQSSAEAYGKDANGFLTCYKKDTERSSQGISSSSSFNFGTQTFTPQIQQEYRTFSFTGNFGLGGEVSGTYLHGTIGGYFSKQELVEKSSNKQAYGYMYAEKAPSNKNVMLDFNREKDVSFNENMKSLPLTNFTYDIYSLAGQGIGGSYRPMRNDFGSVYDTRGRVTSDSKSIGAEVGAGFYGRGGLDFSSVDVQGNSGVWEDNNALLQKLSFKGTTPNSNYESYYFREANEKTIDPNEGLFDALGKERPLRPALDKNTDFVTKVKDNYEDGYGNYITAFEKRENRAKRTQILVPETKAAPDATIPSNVGANQIKKLTTYSGDGKRYVYALPVYNLEQRDVTFAVGKGLTDGNVPDLDQNKRLVKYSDQNNSTGNKKGLDNYFSKTTLPAYAYSYLLTEVFSPDYVDSDNTTGPSAGDIGEYTKFEYTDAFDYEWRTPCGVDGEKWAGYNEGLKSDWRDDKGNYIYGKKQIRYLNKIETKNQFAIFETENRDDAHEINVDGETSVVSMKRLKCISLYSKDHDNPGNPGILIKKINFEYDYSLCNWAPNNTSGAGKLTLKKIYFTYGSSSKGRLSPYEFNYTNTDPTAENPTYSPIHSDRWGNYKRNCSAFVGYTPTDDFGTYLGQQYLPNQDFPYAQQATYNYTKEAIDIDAAVWTLKEIKLPSGGIIKVNYESDDYAYVQDKQAMEMFTVVDQVDYDPANSFSYSGPPPSAASTNINFGTGLTGDKSHWLVVKMRPKNEVGQPIAATYSLADLVKMKQSDMYFKFLVKIKDAGAKDHYEFVSGYAKVEKIEVSGEYVGIKLEPVSLNDNGNSDYNPILKAGIQFARLNLPELVYAGDIPDLSSASGLSKNILNQLVGSSIIKNMIEAAMGPNLTAYNKGVANEFVANKSFLRLLSPDKIKCGGGARVKTLYLDDNWHEMTQTAHKSIKHGQSYSYKNNLGESSGVASYEPMMGGDENPHRMPVYSKIEKVLVPDDEFYQETPFGESFFPGAGVGYSKVTINDIYVDGSPTETIKNYSLTEKSVYEFFTAKDFPTKTTMTPLDPHRSRDAEGNIKSIFKIEHRDFMAASQGFSVELNDMHGKSKSVKMYAPNVTTPFSSIEYDYQLTSSGNIDNKCRVINNKGMVTTANLGVVYDLINDFREEYNVTSSSSNNFNVDLIPALGIPLPIPSYWPAKTKTETKFQTATTTKVVQRFGIMVREKVTNDGSFIVKENIAYDAETGAVLLTKTMNNFNDSIFSLNIPAWWYYDGMSPAYKNIGNTANLAFSGGTASFTNASGFFAPGDELIGTTSGNKFYVVATTNNTVQAMSQGGNPAVGTNEIFTIVRSGNRNMLTDNMMTITTMSNPLYQIANNNYDQVLSASAVEYSSDWKTYCNCFGGGDGSPSSDNPYFNGSKGIWIANKQFTYLTKRTQSLNNNNSNIRKDGVFEDFNPLYTASANGWAIDYNNWTYAKEATENNPFGGVLESKDAIDNHSAILYGFKQTLTVAVADNTEYKELGYDHFEDYNPHCADKHFKFKLNDTGTANSIATEAHTGKRSVKVAAYAPNIYFPNMEKELIDDCTEPPPCMTMTAEKITATTYKVTLTPSPNVLGYAQGYSIIQGNPTVTFNTALAPSCVFDITGTNWVIKFHNGGKGFCPYSYVVNSNDL